AHHLDPSLTDESDPFSYDPSLDIYNPDNGFRVPPEESRYAPEFVERFRNAQQERAKRLVEIARSYVREQNFYRDLMKTPEYKKLRSKDQCSSTGRGRIRDTSIFLWILMIAPWAITSRAMRRRESIAATCRTGRMRTASIR